MGKADHLMKVFFSNPYVFADVFNFWLHDGAKKIEPKNLREASGSLVSLTEKLADIEGKLTADVKDDAAWLPEIETSEQMRDVLMNLICMEDGETVYALLGIEGQTYVDYGMAARALVYDAQQINKQLKAIQDEHKAKGETGKTDGEFLWRFFKTDRLLPVITVVVYLGADEWDGPRTLHDMFETKDQVLLSESVDYRLKLIEPLRMNEEEIYKFQSNMREVLLYMKASGDKQELLKLAKERKLREVDRVTAHLINEVSQSKLKIVKSEKGKGKIDMCKAIEGIRQMGIEEGIEQGIEQKQREVSLRMAARGMTVSDISQIVDAKEEIVESWILEAAHS